MLALVVALAMLLLGGCRAFDPEPVILNKAPETFIIGAAAENTGSVFRRNMRWYGTDRDGEVDHFVFAITDSSVVDPRDPDARDPEAEDALFDPADDILTLQPKAWREVGWTSKTDSTFVFTIGEGPVQTKEVTFHIAAIDDRGAVDATPARLRFFNNSLGNPVVYFKCFVDVSPVGSGEAEWELRWVGRPFDGENGPLTEPIPHLDLPRSPEQTQSPFVGFNRRFKFEWVGDSPNGVVLGFRYKAMSTEREYTPGVASDGSPIFDPDTTEFVYGNSVDPEEIGGGCVPDAASGDLNGCPPAEVRFFSNAYLLEVQAIDVAFVESDAVDEALVFEVNYPPETYITRGDGYPSYRVEDEGGNLLLEGMIAEGDTIPAGAFVEFETQGFDRIAGSLPDSFATSTGDPLLCCDERLDPSVQQVRYQSRLSVVRNNSSGPFELEGFFQPEPELTSTLGFFTEGVDYDFIARTVDEHRRPDPAPDHFQFVGGFPPRMTEVFPGRPVNADLGADYADTLLLRLYIRPDRWPENEIDYQVVNTEESSWAFIPDPVNCGGAYVRREANIEAGEISVLGHLYRFRPRFVGRGDPRDPLSAIQAWAYSLESDRDPGNTVDNGPRESKDLSVFTDSPVQDNRWDFSGAGESFEIFIPDGLWFNVSAYTPGNNASANEEKQGCVLVKQLGNMLLRAQGKTTDGETEYPIFLNTRYDPDGEVQAIFDGNDFDRRSEVAATRFVILLGIEDLVNPTPNPVQYWPDF